MKRTSEIFELEKFKEKIVFSSLLIGSILGFISFIFSLLAWDRAENKIHFLIDFFLLFLFFIPLLFYKRLGIKPKTTIILVGILMLTFVDFYRHGIFSDNKILLILIPIFVFLGYNQRKTILVLLISTLIYIVIAVLYLEGNIQPVTDYAERASHYDVWVMNFMLILIVAVVIFIVIKMFIDIYNNLVKKLRSQNENLRKAKERAEESDKLKSAFLANMSHEIRTPMNGILGFAELLKKPELSVERQKQYVSIIRESGERMLNIINDIVDISRIEAGLMKVDLKESNLNEQIEYIYTFFKPEAESKGINLSFRNSLPDREAIIKTDREKLFAIFTNLVKNAIKYTNEGLIEIGYRKKGSFLELYVKDTGIGIQKNRQKVIFERFIQADIENKMVQQGSGLGLSISKAFIEMLGGKIWVESEEGSGSTFYFTLPYDESKEIMGNTNDVIGNKKAVLNDEKVSGLKILIAEDDESSLILLSVMIEKYGMEILKVRTGIEAIKVCQKNPDIDLILMDIQMPEMDGYVATRKIRQFNKDVIIIAQTAYGLKGDKEKAIDAGCNDYIAKPINKTKLLTMIQKYFMK